MTQALTLSYYSFCEFQIVEIPFKKVDGYKKMSVFYASEHSAANDYPHFKFTVSFAGYYEIRAGGAANIYYQLQLFKFASFKQH